VTQSSNRASGETQCYHCFATDARGLKVDA
jgi:hypothetical protein